MGLSRSPVMPKQEFLAPETVPGPRLCNVAKEDADATRLGAALADEAAARGAALAEHGRRVVAARRRGRGGERERCVAAGSGQCGAAVTTPWFCAEKRHVVA